MKPTPLNRRDFVARSSATVAGSFLLRGLGTEAQANAPVTGPYQAMGTRVGEVSDTTAIVWTRLTSKPSRYNEGRAIPLLSSDEPKQGKRAFTVTGLVDELEGACPGAPGRVQVRYGTKEDLSDAKVTDAMEATEANDFICQFELRDLQPGTVYHYVSEVLGPAGINKETTFRGRFETAVAPDAAGNFRFCVMTCQGYADRGHQDGHAIYPAMAALKPQFTCLTGDLVYYDKGDPDAVTERLARYHWERMFSLPRLMEFNRNHSTYWLKDDHDTLNDDSGPGASMGEFTFAQGQKIFQQQAPMDHDGPCYRTIRWGRDLQVWFSEGRDYRSKNKSPDGPEKTIWGAEQKAWFKRTVKESDATWKVLVSPTPLVGPDRKGKHDNHANERFQHEGDELRIWMKENVPDNFFVITGDRHWQYHSVHPTTGVHEFSAGPASDEHAAGSPGLNPAYHKFHRVKGGFLSVTLKWEAGKSQIHFEHRDVNGTVVYEWKAEREPKS